MPLEYGTPVKFIGRDGARVAFIVDDNGSEADLCVLEPDGVSYPKGVAKRAPKDYDAGGGSGHTWYKP